MATWPTIHGGVVSQYPYGERDEWLVDEATVPSGFSYTHVNNATLLRRFLVSYPFIQDADVTILQNFFDSMRARLGEFSFTDDQGTTWTHTRFDQDELTFHYQAPNSTAVEIRLSAAAAG